MNMMIITKRHLKLARLISSMVSAAASVACGVDLGEAAPEPELVEAAEQAIGEPGCAYLTPTATYTGFVHPGNFTSPQSYDHFLCRDALSIQINNYSLDYVGAKDIGGTFVSWADAGLLAPDTCGAAWVRADLYRQAGGGWTFVGSKQAHGVWSSFFGTWYCAAPGVGFRWKDDQLFEAGASYRIVATARTSTGGATRKLQVRSEMDAWIE